MGGVICTFVVQKMTLNILFLLHLEEEKGLKTKKNDIYSIYIFYFKKKKYYTYFGVKFFFFQNFDFFTVYLNIY